MLLGAPVIGATLWFSDNPGSVVAEWLGWRVETNVPMLALSILTLLAVVEILARLPASLSGVAARMRAKRQARERERGMGALVAALDAVMAGDPAQARRLGDEAGRLLGNLDLSDRVDAIAALAPEPPPPEPGEELPEPPPAKSAKRRILASVGGKRSPESSKSEPAKAAARAVPAPVTVSAAPAPTPAPTPEPAPAPEPSPERDEVLAAFAERVKAGDWPGAEQVLDARTPLTASELAARKAIVLDVRAAMAEDPAESLALARQALTASPSFLPAVLRAARLSRQAGRTADAAAILQEAWRHAPAAVLADQYLALWPEDDAAARLRHVEELVHRHPDHVESHLVAGAAAVAAQSWGLARRHLVAAAKARQTPQVCRLLAEVEDREPGDAAARDMWLRKAEASGLDSGWHCRHCGTAAEEWGAICPHCGEVGGVEWGVPQRLPVVEADAG